MKTTRTLMPLSVSTNAALNPRGTMHTTRTHMHTRTLTLGLVTLLVASSVLTSACAPTKRIARSGLYWETLDTRELEPKEVLTHWGDLHEARVEPLTTDGWAKASVKDDNIQVTFDPRCAGLVELPSEQLQDFQHTGGWHEPLLYSALLGAASGFTVGGVALAASGTGWDDDLAQGHPAIESYNSNQSIDLAMIIGMSVGGAMTVLAGTAFALDYVVTSDVMDTSSLYGLEGHPCDPDDDDLFGLQPTLTSANLVGVGPLKLGIRGILVPSEGESVDAETLTALFAEPSKVDLTLTVAANVPGAGDQRPAKQSLTLGGDADAPVVNTIAQGLANRGVHLNTAGELQITHSKAGYTMTLDAHAAIAPPSGMKPAEALKRLGDSAMMLKSKVVAKEVSLGSGVTLTDGLDTPATLTGESNNGTMRFKATLPVDDMALNSALFAWTGPTNPPVLADTSKGLSWSLPESARVDLQIAQLALLQGRVKASRFKALDLSSTSLDSKARMSKGLPIASLAHERLCQSPRGDVASACQSFNGAWQARAKALDAAAKKQLRRAVKQDMKAVMKYVAQQKRAASKGGDLDIRLSSNADRVAEEQCQMLASVQEAVCAKGTELFDGATCKVIKGCQRKVAGPVKSIIAKLEAEVARRERASKCADKKCPHIGYCSSNTEFNAWGNIKAYPRRCSYMIEPCMRVRGQMQALQCMQKRYKACRRGCGLRD